MESKSIETEPQPGRPIIDYRACDQLFTALAKAQAKLKAVPFDSKNPHFGNEFASLTAIQDATRGPLSEQGLSIIQVIETRGEQYWLVTILGHSSGQTYRSEIKLMMARNDMQSLGSATTYAKRYAWQALAGVSGDQDDDGNAAVGNPGGPQAAGPRSAPKGAPATPKASGKPAATPKEAPANRAQFSRISTLLQERAISDEVFQKYLKVVKDGANSKTMTHGQAEELVGMLEIEDCTEGYLMAEVARVAK